MHRLHRLHRLDPDLVTASWVRWMFAQRLAGHSVAGIARALNDEGVPCPSQVDRQRNGHRSGEGWSLRTVAAILGNPRYTGRQVWNRQGVDHDARRAGVGHGRPVHRWNPMQEWVISKRVAHPALSVRRTSSPSRRFVRPGRPGTAACAATCWRGCCCAGCVGGGWMRTGFITVPVTLPSWTRQREVSSARPSQESLRS